MSCGPVSGAAVSAIPNFVAAAVAQDTPELYGESGLLTFRQMSQHLST